MMPNEDYICYRIKIMITANVRLIFHLLKYRKSLKNKRFQEAIEIIAKVRPNFSDGVYLDNINTIYPAIYAWLPKKRRIPYFIEFINQLTFEKRYNLAFNLAYGLVEKFPSEAEAYLVYCQICIDRKLFYLADKYIFKANSLRENDYRILNCCGIVSHKKGNLEEAKKYYIKAIEISPQKHQAYLNISQIHLDLNEFNKSEIALKKAIELNPTYIPAYIMLAQIMLDIKKDEKEFNLILDKILRIDPHNKSIILLRYNYSVFKKQPNQKYIQEYLQKCKDESEVPNLSILIR